MIRAEQLTVSVSDRNILDDVSFTIGDGKLLVILGPNGAGKSTLLRVLTGQLTAFSGQVLFNDRPLPSLNSAELARCRACLPQNQAVPFDFSVEEIVALGRLPHAHRKSAVSDEQIIEQAMQKTDVLHLRRRSIMTLSGGEAQRVHLARVLAQIWQSPALTTNYLFLDEPTSSLDPQHQHSVLRIAREYADNGGVVIAILHDFNLAARYADEILILQNGGSVAHGTPEQVLQPALLEKVFQLPFLLEQHPLLKHPVILPQ
jgi:iron complex transport system ATP-binding protein